MSAYAALVSLRETVRSSLNEGGMRIGRIRGELQALKAKVFSLLSLLENSATNQSSQVSALETRMRDAAYKAEDLIVESGAQDSEFRRLLYTFRCFVYAAAVVVPPKVILMLDVAVGDLAAFAICIIFALLLHLLLPPDDFPALTDDTPRDLSEVIKEFSDIEKEAVQTEEALSANAALVSLQQNLDPALDSEQRELLEQVTILLDFLKNASDYMTSQKSALQNLDKNIRSEASKAKSALMESPTPTGDSHSIEFSVIVKVSLLITLTSLPVYALLATIMLFFMDYRLIYDRSPQQTQHLVGWFIAIARGFGSLVLGVSGALAVHLAMATKHNSKLQKSRIQNLRRNIGRFRTMVEKADKIKKAGGNPTNLGSTVNNDPVGLDGHTVQIRRRLFQDSSDLEWISIVGVGGIGKTTLARKVYNGSDINHHFDVRAWVTILQDYSLENVLLDLLASVKKFTKILQGPDEGSGFCLRRNLWNRRYLIVMDGVWDTNILADVTRFFPNNGNYSRVLLTSQLSDVASDFGIASHVHEMTYLDEDESWELLHKTVFGANECPTNLESIGRGIARKCRGLPLAIVVTGGLLYKEDRKELIWKEIASSLESQTGEQCMEILGLSYNHLPHHLRPCFLYMGVFKGDAGIPVSTLINLWAAEGFLKPCKPSETLEEVGLRYLNELIVRNLILVRNRSSNGKVKTCSIHGLLRDVSVQNARKEDFFHVVDSRGHVSSEETPRRVSIHPDALRNNAFLCSNDPVRSFLCVGTKSTENSDFVYSGSFMHLRVLDLLVLHFGHFPQQITQLLRLRYLAFHCDGPLPPSISNLHNLVTIVHHHCSLRDYPLLPVVIWSMTNLRHLYVKPGCELSDPLAFRLPWKSFVFRHLQTLVGIQNFRWSKGMINRIPNLKKLGISYHVSSSIDWSTYQLESLVDLIQLESLKISIKSNDEGSGIPNDPPKLAFPRKLKKLSLSGGGIPWESMTTIGALPNLEVLKLKCEAFSGASWETVAEEFPQLIFLQLENMSLRRWETEEADHFPHLQRIVVRSCGMLEEIPPAVGDIPTLELIHLVDCLPSAVDSAKQIQEEQKEYENDSLQLQIS